MCSCGTNCVDASAENIALRTPDIETYKDSSGSFVGYVSAAPLGADDLIYADSPPQQQRHVVLGGWAYSYDELTPEQRVIFDQAYRFGNEDAVRAVTAINELSQPEPEPESFESEVARVVANIDANFGTIVEAFNELGEDQTEIAIALDALGNSHGELAALVAEGFLKTAMALHSFTEHQTTVDERLSAVESGF